MLKHYILRKNELESFEKVSRKESIPYDVVTKTVFNGNEVAIVFISFPETGRHIVERWVDSFFDDLRKDNRKEIYKEAFLQINPLFEEILSTENSGQSWWRPPDWDKEDENFSCDMAHVETFLNQLNDWLMNEEASDS